MLNISQAGYYKYLSHKSSNCYIENQALCKLIIEIFEENKNRYDSIGIAKAFEKKEIHVSRKRVSRLIRYMKPLSKGYRYPYK